MNDHDLIRAYTRQLDVLEQLKEDMVNHYLGDWDQDGHFYFTPRAIEVSLDIIREIQGERGTPVMDSNDPAQQEE
jgi:hypothetical protein